MGDVQESELVRVLALLLMSAVASAENTADLGGWDPERGPMAVGLGIGIPEVAVLSFDARFYREVLFGVDLGYLPIPIGVRTLIVFNADARAEWYPWLSGFHVGSLIGYQRLTLKGKLLGGSFADSTGSSSSSSLVMSNFHVAPYLGYGFDFSGSRLVIQLGYRVAFLGSGEMNHPPESADAEFPGMVESFANSVRRPVSRLAVMPLPYFAIRFQVRL